MIKTSNFPNEWKYVTATVVAPIFQMFVAGSQLKLNSSEIEKFGHNPCPALARNIIQRFRSIGSIIREKPRRYYRAAYYVVLSYEVSNSWLQ